MRTLIILVNRNNKRDTIECLESLRRCEGAFDVFVADNASTDGSFDAIREWAEGKAVVDTSGRAWDAVRDHAIEISDVTFGLFETEEAAKVDRSPRWLTVASTGGSKGFPAGNNVGLRYGLARDYSYFWILNNDTIVEPTALVRLVARMQSDSAIGICGSTLVFYAQPDVVQMWGGMSYQPRTAKSVPIGGGKKYPPLPFEDVFKLGVDHICGAAMFVSRTFLDKVGLMNEGLYLYFEEMDWTLRMKPYFKNGYEPHSIVYHKHGATMGGGKRRPTRHRIYYMTINQVLFTRTHFPQYLASVTATIIAQAVRNFVRGRWDIAYYILKDLIFALTKAEHPLHAI